jgi:cell division septation protein DedD
MPQYERRLYEPSDEAQVFDGGEDGFQEDEGSRLPLLIVIALVVLASFAGVVWVAYTQGVQRGREDAPRVLAAEQGRDTGAPASNPYAKLDIYKTPKSGTDATPAPASPIVPERSPSGAAEPSASSPAPAPTPSDSTAAAALNRTAGMQANSATAVPRAAPAPAKSAEAAKAPAAQNTASTAVQTRPATGTPRPITPPAPRPAAQEQAAANGQQISSNSVTGAAEQQPSAAAQGGGYVLQIGSYPSESEANASWQTYKQAHASVSGYAPDVKSADLGKRGTWYRLRVGPFASLAEANAACAKLKAQGASCFPAKQ